MMPAPSAEIMLLASPEAADDDLSLLRQAIVIALISLVFGAVIVRLARRELLTLRYTLGWLAIAGLGLLASLVTSWVKPAARWVGVTPPVLFAMATSLVLLCISVQLSISLSGLQRQVRKLAESHSLLADDVHATKGAD